MAVALETVVKQLEDSGIVAAGKLENFVPPKAHPTSVEELVSELVKQNHLTRFQAQQVAAGKVKALILGAYTLLDKIGAGGMGQVFKAQHRKMKRLVAIKMLPPAMMKDAAAAARFEREVEAAAKLRHPNIVAADDAAEANGVHFLVMEYVEGKDLSALVKQNGPFPVGKAVNYILQTARGLEFAHSQGVIHRDIKPANLLLDKTGTVKILDMGLARIESGIDTPAQSELTGTGTVMGTVDYMAPEQALSTRHADAKADIYSLGISLYYLIAGRAAYDGETLMAKLLAHREQPIPSLQDAQTTVPKQLEAVFKKMVAKKTEDRYQSMSEVIEALEGLGLAGSIMSRRGEVASTMALSPEDRKRLATKTTKKPLDALTEVSKKSKYWIAKIVGGSFATIIAPILVTYLIKHLEKKDEPHTPPVATAPAIQAVTVQPAATATNTTSQPTVAVASNNRQPNRAWNTPAFQQWMNDVRTMPAEQQIEAVSNKLMELNQEFDGKVTGTYGSDKPRIENGVVTEFGLQTEKVTDISPIRALEGLKVLKCIGSSKSRLSDLSPLSDLPLSGLWFNGTAVSDASPLRGMNLTSIAFTPTNITTGLDAIRQMKSLKTIGLRGDKDRFPAADFWKKYDAGEFGKPTASANLAYLDPAFQRWMKDVQALPAEKQIEAVSKKLKELNPGFDGNITPRIERSMVTGLTFASDNVTDLSPVRALSSVSALTCHGSGPGKGRLSDLSPLQGIPLKYLNCGNTIVSDLSPLNQMKLTGLECGATSVSDLSPIQDCTTLKLLNVTRTKITPISVAALQKALPYCKIEWDDPAKVTTPTTPLGPIPPMAIAPFDAKQAKAHQAAWAKYLGTQVETTNSVGMRMTLIPPGEFLMGSTPEQLAEWRPSGEGEKKPSTDAFVSQLLTEMPQQKVTISRPFLIGSTEVTVAQFRKFVEASKYVTEAEKYGFGNSTERDVEKVKETDKGKDWKNPGYSITDDTAVTQITWNDACAYCAWLSEQEQRPSRYRPDGAGGWLVAATGDGYRLPTEAEWEYACRAGTTTQYSFGDDKTQLERYSPRVPVRGDQPVASKLPNPFGLFDMHGNVYEWCQDWYDGKWYENSSPTDPNGPSSGWQRVIRSGSWYYLDFHCRSAARRSSPALTRNFHHGFRIVRPLDATQSETVVATTAKPSDSPIKPTQPWNTPAFQAWVKATQALPAEQQVEAVSKKLMELNPGFDGKLMAYAGGQTAKPKIKNGVVTELALRSKELADLSPLRALVGLRMLRTNCGSIVDLSPLSGLQLATLTVEGCKVTDLSPVAQMPLESLCVYGTKVSDLRPIAGLRLTYLIVMTTPVTDLSPLRGMPLKSLSCLSTAVSDLSPLHECTDLTSLDVKKTKVTAADVAALQKALPNCKIEWDGAAQGAGAGIQDLGKAWNTPAFQAWVKATLALPAEQQIEAVSKKLMELNPEFDGKLTSIDESGPPKVENGVVTELRFHSIGVTDISPLRAFSKLNALVCYPGGNAGSPLSDLSPLQGAPLAELRFSGTSVSDLSPLEGMPLRTVQCDHTHVSDLSPLEDCKTLTALNVKQTKVTPASVAALQKALPNCKIEWDGAAQGSGAGSQDSGERAKQKTPGPAAAGSK